MKRPWLVPVGLATAALSPQASAGQATPGHAPGIADHSGAWSQFANTLKGSALAVPKSRLYSTKALAATTIRASLSVAQEVPVPRVAGVGATGRLTGTLSGNMLHWRLTVADLSGPVVAAVIHEGHAGQTGPKVKQLCGHCAAPATGVIVLSQAQTSDLLAGRMYLNVGTKRNPNGEIRGRILRVASSPTTPPETPPVGGHVSHASHASHSSHSSHASHSSHYSAF
jgi:hypothetical protein